MTDFARNYDFSVKDGLSSGNANKLIKGSEVDAEFDDIVTMSATKADKVVPSAAGNVALLDAAGNLSDSGSTSLSFVAGTKMLFQQTAAPTGWTKVTASVDDKALRVVSGSVSSGGSVAFSTAFGTTATDSHTLSAAESGLPAHTHQITPKYNGGGVALLPTGSDGSAGVNAGAFTTTSNSTQNASSGHTHGIDLRVTYLDVIIATKD